MKVILLQDVKNLGKKGDIVETAEGYGRNYLLPRKMAKEANAANLNQAKKDQATQAHRAAQRKDEAVMLAAQLKKVHVIVKVRVGENGLQVQIETPMLPDSAPFEQAGLALYIVKEKSGKNIVVVSPSAVPADRLEEAAHAVAAALYKAEEAAKAK